MLQLSARRRTVFSVAQEAEPGLTPIVGRLVRME